MAQFHFAGNETKIAIFVRRKAIRDMSRHRSASYETTNRFVAAALMRCADEAGSERVRAQPQAVEFPIHTEGFGLFERDDAMYGSGVEREIRSLAGKHWETEYVFCSLLWLNQFGELLCTKFDDGSLTIVAERYYALLRDTLRVSRGDVLVWRVHAMSAFESKRRSDVCDLLDLVK